MAATTVPQPSLVSPALDDRAHYEVVNGQRMETPRMGSYESHLANDLASYISEHFGQVGRLGHVVVELLFRIDVPTDLQRRPGLAYVSYERWPRRRRPVPKDAWNVVPDLAVEVVSENNTANEIQPKIQDYFRCGVRLVWVVYPMQAQVYVYNSPTRIAVAQRTDSLDGGEVLPGFRLPLDSLFAIDEDAE
ncbi:MAG: Uma2 family endonuclease [Isosphaeraceae bacterium]